MDAGETGPTNELLAPPPPPPPPGSSKRSGKRTRDDGPMLFGTHLIRHEGKEEPGGDAPPQGAEAIAVPSEPPENKPPPPTAVQVDKGKLYCSLCSSVLTPPIYQCAVGHLACCGCRVKLPGRRCRTCGDRGAAASAYAHCPGLDLFFSDLRVPCDFQEYGCDTFVSYFASAGHRDTCEHAPCHCPEPGCSLLRSPRTLAAHLACDHSWAVKDVPYGAALPLVIPVPVSAPAPSASPAPAPAPAGNTSRLLLLRGDDASLFLVAAGPLGDGAAVSVVLVRATPKPPPLPRFTCTFYANPPPGEAELAGSYFFATVPVRSSALADGAGVAPEKELYFAVPREMLHVDNRELFLSVRIDRWPVHEPALEDKKTMMITDHSSKLSKLIITIPIRVALNDQTTSASKIGAAVGIFTKAIAEIYKFS